MKKILIYYPENKFSLTDFYGTDYERIPEIVSSEFSGKFPNVGNKVWLQAIVTEISDGVNQYEFGYEDISENEINERYDCVLMPLANCFHKGWIPYMKRRATHIRKLKVPVFVIACGVQADSYDDIDQLIDEVREPATEFIRAVYDTGGEFALRGFFTAEFFEKLGFKSAVVTGCPSLFQMGRNLKISNERASEDEFKAAINGTFKLPVYDDDIDNADFVNQGTYGNVLFDPEYFTKNKYGIRRIARQIKRGNICEVKALAEGRIKLFPGTQEWLNYYINNDISFSFGSRIHGTVMPILAGVPSLLYSCDARTREMAEFFDIPYMLGNEDKIHGGAAEKYKLYELYKTVNYQRFNENFPHRFDDFEQFLIKCGLASKVNQNNVFMQRNALINSPVLPNLDDLKCVRRKLTLMRPFLGLLK